MRESAVPAWSRTAGETSERNGPSWRNKYIERSQAASSSAFRICTAARSAPPPASEGSTKQIFRRATANFLGGASIVRSNGDYGENRVLRLLRSGSRDGHRG